MNDTAERPEQPAVHEHIEAELAHVRTGIAQRRALEQALEREAGQWRDAISSKLDSYRDKRGRKQLSGEYTMHLDFERSAVRASYTSAAATAPALMPSFDEHSDSDGSVTRAPSDAIPQDSAMTSAPDWDFPINDDVVTPSEPDYPAQAELGQESSADPFFGGDLQTGYTDAVEQPKAASVSPEPARVKPRRPQPRIIEFPRLFPMEQRESSADELAEPMLDRPRIIDVPEETEQIELPLANIDFAPPETAEQAPVRRSEIEMPMQVAAVSQRVFAAITDWVLVLLATAIFDGIVLNVTKGLPNNKLVLGMGLMVPCVFWGLYHYLFLVHSAVTPGMQLAQLQLASFNGQPTNQHIRRSRALAMLLSCASAGLGLAWAFVDEDTLCWHDKISRTYLTRI